MRGRQTVAVCFAVTMAACDPDGLLQAEDDFGELSARDLESNGFRLNGFRLNSFRLNGFRLNGFRLNGAANQGDYIDLEKFELPAGNGNVAYAWLADSELRVRTSLGTVLAGAQLVGSTLHFAVVEGTAKKRMVKITGAAPLASDPSLWLYNFELKEGTGPWEPLCLTSLGLATEAILIGEVWDPETGSRISPTPVDAITLACRDAALGKCAEWGYHPWELPEYHQACTRLVRADYCGDGVPHTVEGVWIHVLDQIGIEEPDPDAVYVVEAEWGPNGATCLNPERTRLLGTTMTCQPAACGESFASGGLIQTGVFTF